MSKVNEFFGENVGLEDSGHEGPIIWNVTRLFVYEAFGHLEPRVTTLHPVRRNSDYLKWESTHYGPEVYHPK